jgi:hypothetical protein
VVFCSTVGGIYVQDSRHIREGINGNVIFDLTFDIEKTYLSAIESFECPIVDLNCQDWTDLAGQAATKGLLTLRQEYISFVNDFSANHLLLLKVALAILAAASLIIVGIPLTISLMLSFNFTLWILSKITSSSITLVSMIVVDLFVAPNHASDAIN